MAPFGDQKCMGIFSTYKYYAEICVYVLAISCHSNLKFQLLAVSKTIPIYYAKLSICCRGVEEWSSSLQSHNFIGPQVRIQVRTENVSVSFFCADFSTFSYLKLAKHSFGGVHKQYGPKRERGRLFYPMYLMTWFIVQSGFEVWKFTKRGKSSMIKNF